jgi:hypothetical protein
MATTSPARIDDDLYASAKLAGEAQSRSASQQVAHWARIGREIEASGALSLRDINDVLSGSRSYDGLSAKEQAIVRAEWSARMDEVRSSLNLADEFSAEGRRWVELDANGAVVERSRPAPARKRQARPATGAKSTTKKAATKKVAASKATAKKSTAKKAGRRRA